MKPVRIEHPKGRAVILHVPRARTGAVVDNPVSESKLAVSGKGKGRVVHGYAVRDVPMSWLHDPRLFSNLSRTPVLRGATEVNVLRRPHGDAILFSPIPKVKAAELKRLLLARK
jgi:hypothetical protein